MAVARLWILSLAGAIGLSLAVCGCQRDPGRLGPTTRDGRVSPLLSNLGKLHRPVTTSSKGAQRFFDQGLTLTYAFNHAEAVRSFQETARLDPNCAMAYWGQALALGPNINDPAPDADRERQAFEAVRRALARTAGASVPERALIGALARRYSDQQGRDRKELNMAYAEAMAKVYEKYPEDPDIATLYAASIMNTMPWDYWTKDGRPKPGTERVLSALEDVIRRHPNHPGGNHYYIHAVEASADPDRGVPSADRLGGLVPGAGHLVHMPAHIYIRVGRYADASAVNVRAIAADEDYITQCRAQGIYPAAYYPHNIHFLTATLAMEGRSKEMMAAVHKVGAHHPDAMLKGPGSAFPRLLRALPMLALVRFGRWDEVLQQPEPSKEFLFQQAIWHYGRGMAFRANGQLALAEKELAKLEAVAKDPSLETMKIWELNSLGALAGIASEVLPGELAASRKRYDEAIRHLRKAVEREDALLYSEPPDWPNPPRHNLGAVLLEAGRPADAERVYREDLRRHRNNGWSLYGLARSLEAQGKGHDAGQVNRQFEKSWERADIRLTASRF